MNVATFADKWRIRSGGRLQLGRIPSPQDRGVRLLTRNGKDWNGRFPTIVDAAAQLKPRSCLIDDEVVCCDAGDIERALAAVPRNQNSGLIVIARALGLLRHCRQLDFLWA